MPPTVSPRTLQRRITQLAILRKFAVCSFLATPFPYLGDVYSVGHYRRFGPAQWILSRQLGNLSIHEVVRPKPSGFTGVNTKQLRFYLTVHCCQNWLTASAWSLDQAGFNKFEGASSRSRWVQQQGIARLIYT